jgi:hypothetical protein
MDGNGRVDRGGICRASRRIAGNNAEGRRAVRSIVQQVISLLTSVGVRRRTSSQTDLAPRPSTCQERRWLARQPVRWQYTNSTTSRIPAGPSADRPEEPTPLCGGGTCRLRRRPALRFWWPSWCARSSRNWTTKCWESFSLPQLRDQNRSLLVVVGHPFATMAGQ